MQPLPPSPRLQVSPHQDLKSYDAAKHRELAGGQRPITAAMQETAKQGWGPPR
jgi:hypothetical protein